MTRLPARLVVLLPLFTTLLHSSRPVFGFATTSFPKRRHRLLASVSLKNAFESEQEHLENQVKSFDFLAGLPSKSGDLPPEVNAVYKHFAQQFLEEMTTHARHPKVLQVLDVGCGAGVFFRFLLEEANRRDIAIHLDAVDVSPVMVQKCREHATGLLEETNSGDSCPHSISVFQEDASQFLNDEPTSYDGIIANACLANFWDPMDCLASMATGLFKGGVLVVSHPVGAEFVKGLRQDNPQVTPHTMPTSEEFQQAASSLPLTVLQFQEELPFYEDGGTTPMYYASAVKQAVSEDEEALDPKQSEQGDSEHC